MKAKRLFTAILLPEETKDVLSQKADEIRDIGRRGRFVSPQNYHLTLNFIGETEREVDIIEVIKSVRIPYMVLELAALNLFHRASGDILIVQLKENPALNKMQKELAKKFWEAGFELESRTYTPHLTLARNIKVDTRMISSDWKSAGRFEVDGLSLMESCFSKVGGISYEERFFLSCSCD